MRIECIAIPVPGSRIVMFRELANIDLTDIFSTSRKTQVTVLSRVASLISVMLMLILWFVISDPQYMGAHTQRRSRGFCR